MPPYDVIIFSIPYIMLAYKKTLRPVVGESMNEIL
jgi:hypothetical protein